MGKQREEEEEKKKICLRLLGLLHGEHPLSKDLDVDSHHGELLQRVLEHWHKVSIAIRTDK